MTAITKPVHRETDTYQRDRGTLRPIVASLTREGVALRLKGCRYVFLLPYSVAWSRAAAIEADRKRSERKAARKAKKERAA